MTNKAMQTYVGLMNLVKNAPNDGFFYKDFIEDNITYRLFDYGLVSWRGFQQAYAKHCRGIMYDISVASEPILVSLPPDKFFNYSEGAIDHSRSELLLYMEKRDGSLVSSYLHNGELRLKSKSSISSEPAKAALRWLSLPENAAYYDDVYQATKRRCTVNFEWTSPDNHIVVRYACEQLTMINSRNMDTFASYYMVEHPHYVQTTPVSDADMDIETLVATTYNDTQGEGIVLLLQPADGSERYLVKVKNHLYGQLHGLKDSINNSAKLAALIIDGTIDDIRQQFSHQPEIMTIIDEAESRIIPIYNQLIETTETFYKQRKHLERKDYAQQAYASLGQGMNLAMDLYIGRTPKYKEHSIKNVRSIYDV